jgi:hypothetical protein
VLGFITVDSVLSKQLEVFREYVSEEDRRIALAHARCVINTQYGVGEQDAGCSQSASFCMLFMFSSANHG